MFQATTEDRKHIWERIQNARIAFFTTLSEDNGLRARPLATQRVDAERSLWFFIARDSDLAKDTNANPRALVTYSDERDGFYASLSGTALVMVDPEKAHEMWSDADEAWFPGGPQDPNLALLRVDVDHGETWEPASNELMQFLSVAAAPITHAPLNREGAQTTVQ